MSLQSPSIEVVYPESDGKPMGETDLHRDWMVRIIDLLKHRYAGQRVYVSGDLLVYYQEGNPRKFVVPDAFVVKDCDPGPRRTFLIWKEERVPNVVFETTSLASKKKDTRDKPELYARLGIPEYFVYDPTADYLDPPLAGYRLTPAGYVRLEPDARGRLRSEELSVELLLEDGELAVYDAASGERLLTEAEAAEAEVERLRQKLREHGISE